MHRQARTAALFLGVVLLAAPSARGDIFRDIALALGYANFNIEGSHNVLSGGDDFLINTTFLGNPLDFGVAELTLQGPISLGLSTGGRGIPEWEFSFQTALDPQGQAVPLNYLLDVDVGGQETQIGGNLLVDADFSINGFGFYDLELVYSSRQSVVRSGRFADDIQDFDGDIGPINISGNIIADVLAMLTDPFFESTNTVNIFDSFSGRAQLEKMIQESNAFGLTQLAETGRIVADARLASRSSDEGSATAGERGASFPGLDAGREGAPAFVHVVPEPAVVLLLLVGLPAVIFGRRRSTS